MNEQNFKRKVDHLWNNLDTSINLFTKSDKDWVLKAEEIVMEADAAIRKLKEYVQQYTFKD